MSLPSEGRNRKGPALNLLDLQRLDIEDERGVRRNVAHVLAAVGEVRGNGDSPLAANLNALDADLPALDDFTGAQLEAEWLALLVRVEDFAAVFQLADVAHAHTVPVLRRLATSDLLIIDSDALDNLGTES